MRVAIDASGPFTPRRHSLLEAMLLALPFAFASRIIPKRRDSDIDRNLRRVQTPPVGYGRRKPNAKK